MKKLLLTILFTLVLSGGAYSKEMLIENNDDLKIYNSQILKQSELNDFLKAGFEIVNEAKNLTSIIYVLKRGDQYIGCRGEEGIKETICYEIKLEYKK